MKEHRKHKIERWCRTTEWKLSNLNHDIAVVYVKPPFDLDAKDISSIELNTHGNIEEGTLCQIFGWGLVYSDGKHKGDPSRYLQGTSLPIRNLQKCKRSYASTKMDIISYSSHICAGLQGIDSCFVSSHDFSGQKDLYHYLFLSLFRETLEDHLFVKENLLV